jgi:hypothetical protein
MRVVMTNLGPHSGRARNALTFQQAYSQATNAPTRTYTAGHGSFTVLATIVSKGDHGLHGLRRFTFLSPSSRGQNSRVCSAHVIVCKTAVNVALAGV